MAIVEFGPLIVGARGSIGGCTFSNAGSGATVRAKPRPPKPKNALQQASQSYMAAAAGLWLALSTINKGQWAVYSQSLTLYDSLGRAYTPTARQVFIWSYCVQKSGGLTPDMDYPTALGLATLPTIELTYTTPALTITDMDPAPNAASQFVVKTYLADRAHAFNRMRLLGTVAFLGNEGQPITVAADINGAWGDAEELRVWISVRMLDETLRLSTRLWQYLDFESDV